MKRKAVAIPCSMRLAKDLVRITENSEGLKARSGAAG
jgi:hypothetical protein